MSFANCIFNGKEIYFGNKTLTSLISRGYFNFGNTYTLNSGTPASIDLTSTALYGAKEDFICLYMTISINNPNYTPNDSYFYAEAGGLSYSGIKFGNDDNFINIGLGWFTTSWPIMSNTGLFITGTPSGRAVIWNQNSYHKNPPRDLKLIFSKTSQGEYEVIPWWSKTEWGANWIGPSGSLPPQPSVNPDTFTSISSPGEREGFLSITNFKAAGFDTFEEAFNWEGTWPVT